MEEFIMSLSNHLISKFGDYESTKAFIALGFFCGLVFMLILNVILDIIFSELHFDAEHKRERQHSEEFDSNLSE